MVNSSALLGSPPQTHDDTLIRRGLLIIAPSELNPVPGMPFGLPRPAGYVFESWSTSVQVGVAVAMFIVLAFTVARLAVRRFHAHRLGLDDLAIIPGALGCLAYLAAVIVQTTVGCLGKHTFDCTYQQINGYFEWAQIDFPIFYFTVFTIKLSIALQNRRMTLMASRSWQVTHWIFIATFLVLIPLMTVLNMIRCLPIGATYNLIILASIPHPAENVKCVINATALSYASRVVHVVTDIALLSVPVIIVARLQMARKKKIRLISIFAVGGMSTISSIVRCTRIGPAAVDITYDTQLVYAFNIIDIVTAAVVANMPALNVVVDVAIDKMRGLSGSGVSIRSLLRPGSNRPTTSDHREVIEKRTESANAKAPAVSMLVTTKGTLGAAEFEHIGVEENTHERNI